MEGSIEQVLAGLADWCVVRGDCEAVMAGMPRDCVDITCADGPYSGHTHTNMRGNRGQNIVGRKKIVARDPGFEPLTPEQINDHTAEICRITSQWIMLLSDDLTLPLWREGVQRGRGKYLRTIPWVRWASPNFSGMCPPSGAEFVAVCRPRKFTKSKLSPDGSPKRRKWLNGGRKCYDTKCLRAGSKEKKELLEWSADEKHPGHRAQKPIALMQEMLSDCGQRGDVVFDCYAGVGTTGVAALRLGMRVILVERDARNALICRKRLEAESKRIEQLPAAEAAE